MSDEHRSGGKGMTFLSTHIDGGEPGGLPMDVERNTYTADREPGLHVAGMRTAPDHEAERNHWIRMFNRLEAAVRRHMDSKPWNDEHDDQLHASYRAVLKDGHDR